MIATPYSNLNFLQQCRGRLNSKQRAQENNLSEVHYNFSQQCLLIFNLVIN
ncbi:hypothetical protein K661_03234 [Piscirickettsia salmonis LF-89 = ATCC VR-1361]|nr:hypothetical protein K661_03234 [Piscirickettsia salmonis LF-89 = ATCC VR-1361]